MFRLAMFPMGEFHIVMFGTLLRLTMTVQVPLFRLAMFLTAPFLLFLKGVKLFKKGLECLKLLVHLINPFVNQIWLRSDSF